MGPSIRFIPEPGETVDAEVKAVSGGMIGAVSGRGPGAVSWVLEGTADGVEAARAYRAGDRDEFYSPDNLPFRGEVVELDADGVLYVSSEDLLRNVWVDPVSMRTLESSPPEFA